MDRSMGRCHHFQHHHHHRPLMPPTPTRSAPIPDDPSQFADPEDDDDDDEDMHMSQPSAQDHPTTRMMNIKQEDPAMNDHYHITPTHMELVPCGFRGLYHTGDPHHLLSSVSPDPVGSNHMDAVTISSAGTVHTDSSLVSRTTSRSTGSNPNSSLSSSSCNNNSSFHPHGAAAAAHPYEDEDEDHWIAEPNRKRPHYEAPPPLSAPQGTVNIPRVHTEMSLVATSRILQDDVSGLSSDPLSSEHPPLMAAAVAMSSTFAPRARLHHWYARPPRSKVISNAQYHGWPDSMEKTHIQQWTAILVCPLTGELFRAGPCPSLFEATPITLTHYNEQDHDGAAAASCTTWWFAKKTYAEHGAAARAYDCWTLREGDHDAPKMMGTEPPDREPIYRLPDLMVIPYEIRQNILRQQAEIRRIGGLPPVRSATLKINTWTS